eukprot:4922978-Pyramimonas_sp.AAC.1
MGVSSHTKGKRSLYQEGCGGEEEAREHGDCRIKLSTDPTYNRNNENAKASRIENGSFSKCGSRLSAAHIVLEKMLELH